MHPRVLSEADAENSEWQPSDKETGGPEDDHRAAVKTDMISLTELMLMPRCSPNHSPTDTPSKKPKRPKPNDCGKPTMYHRDSNQNLDAPKRSRCLKTQPLFLLRVCYFAASPIVNFCQTVDDALQQRKGVFLVCQHVADYAGRRSTCRPVRSHTCTPAERK
eukprot:scpid104061/ scgid35397/ 